VIRSALMNEISTLMKEIPERSIVLQKLTHIRSCHSDRKEALTTILLP
jgi:hypothetical protein